MNEPPTDQPESDLSRLAGDLVQPTIRLGVALAILLVLRYVLVRIPGTDMVVLEPDIAVATVVWSALTLVMMGAVLNYAVSVGGILQRDVGRDLDLARITQVVGVLAVLVWAYTAFRWVPYFQDNPQQYDTLFLVLGLLFGGWLAVLLYTNVDTVSELIAGEVRGDSSSPAQRSFEDATSDDPAPDDGEEQWAAEERTGRGTPGGQDDA